MPLRVVLHGTGAERVEVGVDGHVLRREVDEVAHEVHFTDFGQRRGVGERGGRQEVRDLGGGHVALGEAVRTATGAADFKQQFRGLRFVHISFFLGRPPCYSNGVVCAVKYNHDTSPVSIPAPEPYVADTTSKFDVASLIYGIRGIPPLPPLPPGAREFIISVTSQNGDNLSFRHPIFNESNILLGTSRRWHRRGLKDRERDEDETNSGN